MNTRAVWAQQIAPQVRAQVLNLETAITSIRIKDLTRGASSIDVTLADPRWDLIDGAFFDSDGDGRLDRVDVNYPLGSKFWWRLTQVRVASLGAQVTLTFIERTAAILMERHGPVKVSRASRTRAQFLKGLCDRIEAYGGIRFHSTNLGVRQRIKRPAVTQAKPDKHQGIHPSQHIEIKNWDGATHVLTAQEIKNANTVINAALYPRQGASPVTKNALLALLEACIVEGPFFQNPTGGDASSVGILQLLAIHGSVAMRRDIAKVVELFLYKGFAGQGLWILGAIALSKQNPAWTPGEIAATVQGPQENLRGRYEKVREGAETVLNAYGGMNASVTVTQRTQYNFEVGTPGKPHETFWEAIQRLSNEVRWPFLIDGPDVYYDPETSLVRNQVAAVVHRDDAAIIDFDCVWDVRDIATEATLTLTCDPFEFRAGEVLMLEGFGPASSGSTVKLPGRWLIDEISRDADMPMSVFQLKQPERPRSEPAPETRTKTKSSTGARVDQIAESGAAPAGSPKQVIENTILPIGKKGGLHCANGAPLTPENVEMNNAAHTRLTVDGNVSDHSGPGNERWAVDMGMGTQTPTPRMDRVAEAVAQRFNIPWSKELNAPANAEFDVYTGTKHARMRIQLIYRAPGHLDHIHVGIALLTGDFATGDFGGGNF